MLSNICAVMGQMVSELQMYSSVKFSVSSAIKGFRVKWQLHHLQRRTGYPIRKLLLRKSRNAFFTIYVNALVCLFIQCHLSASSNCSLFSALLSISTSPANEIIKKDSYNETQLIENNKKSQFQKVSVCLFRFCYVKTYCKR